MDHRAVFSPSHNYMNQFPVPFIILQYYSCNDSSSSFWKIPLQGILLYFYIKCDLTGVQSKKITIVYAIFIVKYNFKGQRNSHFSSHQEKVAFTGRFLNTQAQLV